MTEEEVEIIKTKHYPHMVHLNKKKKKDASRSDFLCPACLSDVYPYMRYCDQCGQRICFD